MKSWYFYDKIYDLMGADYKQHFNLITCNIKHKSYSQYNMGKWICNLFIIFYFLNYLFLFLFLVDTPTRTTPEREIICVTLKKDPKLGFGEWKWTCIFYITLSICILIQNADVSLLMKRFCNSRGGQHREVRSGNFHSIHRSRRASW